MWRSGVIGWGGWIGGRKNLIEYLLHKLTPTQSTVGMGAAAAALLAGLIGAVQSRQYELFVGWGKWVPTPKTGCYCTTTVGAICTRAQRSPAPTPHGLDPPSEAETSWTVVPSAPTRTSPTPLLYPDLSKQTPGDLGDGGKAVHAHWEEKGAIRANRTNPVAGA